jgi:hypothetical protein
VSEALKETLCKISMFAQINIRQEEKIIEISQEELKQYSAIVVGFKDFSEVNDLQLGEIS